MPERCVESKVIIVMRRGLFVYLVAGLMVLGMLGSTSQVQAYGGRPVGIGMAYTAISDDASGVFFNPAGLAKIGAGDRFVSIMIKANDRDKETLDSIAFSGQAVRNEQRVKYSIEEYLAQDFKPPIHEEKLYFNYALGGIFATTDTLDDYYKSESVYFAAGRKILSEPKLSVGGKIIGSTHDTRDQHGSMSTLGLGLLYEFNNVVDIGMTVDDVFSDGPFVSPIILNLGVLLNVTEATRIAVDGYNLTSEKESWRWRGKGGAEFRAGLEKTFLNETFVARIGSMNGNLNLGFAAEVTPQFMIEYAFNYDNKSGVLAEPQDQQHFMSARIKF